MSASKTTSDYHAEGQRDGAAAASCKDYSPGISSLLDSSEKVAEQQSNSDAYRAGYDNGYKQR